MVGEYFILGYKHDDKFCKIHDIPDDIEDPFKIAQGELYGPDYNENQLFQMSGIIKGKVIPDLIGNALSYLMVSREFKEVVERNTKTNIEYLPFKINNHRNKVEKNECYILNITTLIDCVNFKNTIAAKHPLLDGQFMSISKLVLDLSSIDSEYNIFRIKSKPDVIIIRRDLAGVLQEKNLSGWQCLNLADEVDI